jgi:hypothetical protein
MKADTDSSGNLVVSHSESWLLGIAIVLAAGSVAPWFGSETLVRTVGWSVGLLAIATLLYSGCERSVFVFDVTNAAVVWRRVKPFSRAIGRVAFADITGLSLQQDFGDHGQRTVARRVVIHTNAGIIPITTSFEMSRKKGEQIATRIIDALHQSRPQVERLTLVE